MRPLLLLAVLFSLPAHAKRPNTTAVPKVPAIEEVVAAEGFTPTPSQSEIYKPGAVLVPNDRGGHDVVVEGCIETEPSVSIMSQSSIATTLAGGVSARLGVARGGASAGVEKRLSFVDPEQRTIPLAKLLPSETCIAGVKTAAAYQDLSDAIVLHDVLVAIIKNTVCTKADSSGGVVALAAAEAAAFSECVQESDGQVPLGYKAVPLPKALALAGAGGASVSPIGGSSGSSMMAAPQSPTAPPVAQGSGGFGSMGSLDVDARLREQACTETAKVDGAAARVARLQAAERAQQEEASSAWRGMSGDLEKCTQLPRSDRTDCIAMAEKWLSVARDMSVSLDAGVETVETECGPREAVFPSESHRVAAGEVGEAEDLLVRLQAADAVAPSTPTFTSSAAYSGELTVGMRVRRGPDWKWDDQDGGSGRLGTVITAPTGDSWARVQWDAGDANTYRWGHEGAYDLIVVGGSLTVGTRVQRGPDWKWDDQDGGAGRLGTVTTAPTEESWARVEWDSGGSNTYRWGHEDAYDLIVVGGGSSGSSGGYTARVSSGERVRVVEVSTEDAYYEKRRVHIGTICTVGDSPSLKDDGWVGGQFNDCDNGMDPYYYKVRVKSLSAGGG